MQQLDFAAGPETYEKRRRKRMRLVPRVPEAIILKSALKHESLTKIGSRAGLAGFRELYYHLEDTERKWSGLHDASCVLF